MTPAPITQRPRPQEMLVQLERNPHTIYRSAYELGMSLSAYLEAQDPSEEYHDGLDAFSRLLKCANIRATSIPHLGIWADKLDVFDRHAQARALLPEWFARQWRRAGYGQDVSTRSIYQSGDATVGSALRPFADSPNLRMAGIAPAIPISEIVAITTPITGNAYRAAYLVDDPTQERQVRVAEGAELPSAKLTDAQHTINLYKYGRILIASYEQLRRQPMDRLAIHIARMAVQAQVDKLATILDVLINGDGNSGTAATNYNASSLDAASTGGVLTLNAWLSFKMKFLNPYMLTHVLAREAGALKALTLNTGNANIPLVTIQSQSGFGSFRPINPGLADNVALGWTPDAPSNALVGIDSRFALERVVEIGATISEVDRYISRQTEALTMTETEGYSVFDAQATKTLTLV